MATQWLRRGWLAACASALLLASCGGGSIVDPFSPSRIVAFGDAMGDAGQNGARYTVNDGTVNVWTVHLAAQYGLGLEPSTGGGLDFATGNARVVATPDAAGNAATPTVKQQVDAFLARSAFTADDLVVFSAGTSDVIAEAQAVITGAQTEAQMLENLGKAGRDLGAQVRRVVNAGATHVVVAGPYNLGRSPWAVQVDRESLLEEASSRFNDQFLVSVVDLGASVLYVDAALFYNQATSNPTTYELNEDAPTTVVCTTVDPGPGIGTGAGQVNSNLCTQDTIVPDIDYTQFLFADRVYPTPRGHQLLGDYAYDRLRDRF